MADRATEENKKVEVLRTTALGRKVTVIEDGIQKQYTPEELESMGVEIPEEVQKRIEYKRDIQEKGLNVAERERREKEDKSELDQFQEETGIYEPEAAEATLQRYKENPQSEEFKNLSAGEIQTLNRATGLDEKTNLVEIAGGGLITDTEIAKISEIDPIGAKLLQDYGAEAYNRRVEEISGYQGEQLEEFKRTHTEVSPGEWVNTTEWNQFLATVADPEKYRRIAQEEGLTAMRQALQSNQAIQQAIFERNNVQLGDGVWVSRNEFQQLPENIRQVGLSQGKQALDNAIDEANRLTFTALPQEEEPKRWYDRLTRRYFTNAEKNKYLAAHPLAEERIVKSNAAIREEFYNSKFAEYLRAAPEFVVNSALSVEAKPMSAYVSNPQLGQFLDAVQGGKNVVVGAGAAVIAAVVGMPYFLATAVVDPIGTGRGAVNGVIESASNVGTSLYLGATTAEPVYTVDSSTKLGVDLGNLIVAAMATKAVVSGVRNIAFPKGQKPLIDAKPQDVKAWRGVAVSKLKTGLKEAGAKAETIRQLNKLSDGMAQAAEMGDMAGVEAAARGIIEAIGKDNQVNPIVKEMVQDGGRYIESNPETLARTSEYLDIFRDTVEALSDVNKPLDATLTLWQKGLGERAYRVTLEEIAGRISDIKDAGNWGELKTRLYEIKNNIDRANKENTTLSESLREVDWFKETPDQKPFREQSRQLSWEEAAEQNIISNRLQKLIERMPQLRRDALYKALEKTGEARKTALKDMWEYLEDVYGKENLKTYLKTGRWKVEPPEGLEGSIKGVEDAAKITEEFKKLSETDKELKDALEEIDRILEGNRDKPDRAPLKKDGGVAVKEKPITKTETAVKEVTKVERETKPETSPRESVFPGTKTRPSVAPAPLTMPLADAIGVALEEIGIATETQVAPSPAISPAVTPSPITTPSPAGEPLVSPQPTSEPLPTPEPTPEQEPEPSPEPEPQPTSEPLPTPEPTPEPEPLPFPEPVLEIPPAYPPPPDTPPPGKTPPKEDIFPRFDTVKGIRPSKVIPKGSIAWAQGSTFTKGGGRSPQWYYIPPPYNQDKPVALSEPPIGAQNTGSLRPYDTIQIIGQSRARVPNKVDIDLGWSDITVIGGKKIVFRSGGERTNIGTRINSPTMGMDLDGEFELENIRSVKSKAAKTRPTKRNKENWLDKLTSLRGFRP